MPNTESEKNRYVGQNLGKDLLILLDLKVKV